jgi:hypothetical protein
MKEPDTSGHWKGTAFLCVISLLVGWLISMLISMVAGLLGFDLSTKPMTITERIAFLLPPIIVAGWIVWDRLNERLKRLERDQKALLDRVSRLETSALSEEDKKHVQVFDNFYNTLIK